MMRSLFTILIFTMFFGAMQAQITVDFTGLYLDATVDLTEVTVENLTNGEQVVLSSGFAVDLVETLPVSELKSEGNLNAYPNPFADEVTVNLPTSDSGRLNITIFDVSGKNVAQLEADQSKQNQTLIFAPAQSGIYFLNILSGNLNQNIKLICTNASASTAQISISGQSSRSFSADQSKSNPQLLYSPGDILKYTGVYDTYTRILTASPTQSQSQELEFQACIDYELNSYAVTKQGDLWWMAENLKSKKYANGANISGSYAYENSATNEEIYGRLYTWAAAMNGATGNNNMPSGVKGVCPDGWHFPSELEWDNLRDVLGGQSTMGGMIKETGTDLWASPNTDATNASGMSVRPSGMRFDDGDFQYLTEGAYFWNCSDFDDLDNASGYNFSYNSGEASYIWNAKGTAQSVRCVMDTAK